MPFKMRYKNLEEVIDQLYNASKKHAGQAKVIEKHLEKLESSPVKATRKVCLPLAKIRRMSKAQKQKVIRAKQAAANKGETRRSSSSNIKDGSTRSRDLRHWVKQDWRQVANPSKKCGEK